MERRRFTREFKLEAARLIKERGVSFAQASHDLSVHQSQLRSWVKALAADPQHAFPGQGQMKPEQLVPLHSDYDFFGLGLAEGSGLWVGAAHFGASFVGCEHPFDASA